MQAITQFILTAGIVMTLIILFLLFKTKRDLPRKILIAFFIIFLFVFIESYGDLLDLDALIIFGFILDSGARYLLGPLILIYIKSLFENPVGLVKKNRIHFLPALIYYVVLIIPLIISILSRKYLFSYIKFAMEQDTIVVFIESAVLLIYTIYNLRLFNKYRNLMKSSFSNFEEQNFGWVKKMLFGMLFIVFVDFVLVCLDFYIESDTRDTGIITVSLMVFYAYYIAYYGIKQSKVLIPLFLTESQQQLEVAGLAKTEVPIQNALSSESNESIAALKADLVKALEVDQLYLDEELTLSKLANSVSTTDKKLSTLLNKEMNTTFYDFINKYRVESVKEKIADEAFSHYTLLAIGYESGFKSKTSFNRIFKKEVGVSPSDFKKQLPKSGK